MNHLPLVILCVVLLASVANTIVFVCRLVRARRNG